MNNQSVISIMAKNKVEVAYDDIFNDFSSVAVLTLISFLNFCYMAI